MKKVLSFSLCLWIVLGASPAVAQDNQGDDKEIVILTGRVDVAEGQTVGDVVIFNGPVNVAGTVEGGVVAFNGRVSVSGTVEGDVVAFNGRIVVEDGALIEGDIRSRHDARVSEGAEVRGDESGLDYRFADRAIGAARIAVWVGVTISALLLAFLFVLLFPAAADAVAGAGVSRTGASIGWGLALFFCIPLIAILLLITVLALPLGIAVLLAIVPLFALGYVATAYALGRRLVGSPRSRALAALAGVAILRGLGLIPFLGGLLWFVATAFGLGLLFVAALASRSRAEPAGP
jgi:cytoskeletal protein CcmA (bactofilin family)